MLEAPRRGVTFVGLLTPEQAAQRLGVSVDELDAMRANRSGPVAFELSRRVVRYAPSEVAAWETARAA
jgi:predicted DNA-binding transcriptional regulator AlpA